MSNEMGTLMTVLPSSQSYQPTGPQATVATGTVRITFPRPVLKTSTLEKYSSRTTREVVYIIYFLLERVNNPDKF